MRVKIGVMGSAATDSARLETGNTLVAKAERLAQDIAAKDVVLLTGAATGIVYVVGKTAHEAGGFHIGISPGSNEHEHVELYKLPLDACDTLIYTGFGLKGRNVVLVRSCDIVIFIAGSIGSLNEFTIAYDEGKIIGCLKGSGGTADEIERVVRSLNKPTSSKLFFESDPVKLLDLCLAALS